MRTFSLDLTEYFGTGLRKEERTRKNTPQMILAHQVRAYEGGLHELETIEEPIQGISVDFPFPQIYRGKSFTLLMTRDEIYIVTEDGWNLEKVTTYDAYSENTPLAIPAGDTWKVVDNHQSLILLNGYCMVIYPYKRRLLGLEEKWLVVDNIWVRTGCAHKGRQLLGGFEETHTWNTDWQNIWDELIEGLPTSLSKSSRGLGKNFVLWSEIGGHLLWLYDTDLLKVGGLGDGYGFSSKETNPVPILQEMILRNEFGWMPMSWKESVVFMEGLGDHVIVYGETGVSVITPTLEPVPTFGEKLLRGVGVSNRGAIGIGNGYHIWIDESGYLWTIDTSLKIERLGYREHFKPLLKKDFNITFNHHQEEFYISTEDTSFVLSRGGLTSQNRFFTGVISGSDGAVAISEQGGIEDMILATDTFNMNIAALKFLQSIHIQCSSYEGLLGRIGYKVKPEDEWRYTSWQPFNQQGVLSTNVTGLDFRVAIKGTSPNTYNISSASIWWSLIDRRGIRGAYAE